MAAIYQREGSRYWMARFKNPAGQWVARSTKQTNPAEARRIAFLWEDAGQTLKVESATAAQVDRVVRGIWERYSGKKIEHAPIREFCQKWLARVKATKANATHVRYEKVIRDFLEHLGERAGSDVRSIAPHEIQAFVDNDAKAGKSSATVATNAKVVRAVFNSALRGGLIERNPVGMVEVEEVVHEEREPFTLPEVRLLLAYLEENQQSDWTTAVLIGFYVGLRLGDTVNLRWDNIDLAAKTLSIVPQKTARKKKKLLVPLHPALLAHFDRLASTDAAQLSLFVCPKLAGKPIAGRAGLSAEFIAIARAAGIDLKLTDRTGTSGHSFVKKSFHSLRHTFNSELGNKGVAPDLRAKLSGHASERMNRRYTHLEQRTLRRAVAKLPRL
jgi:integrase